MRCLGTDITLDGMITVLDEHYNCCSYHALYDDNSLHMFDYIFIASAIRSAMYNKCMHLYNIQAPFAVKWQLA